MRNEDYYTASEAMAKIGLSKTEFHRKVNLGQIPKFTRPGRKHGVYPKKEIDILAEIMNIVFQPPERFEFSKSTLIQQKEEMDIGIRSGR